MQYLVYLVQLNVLFFYSTPLDRFSLFGPTHRIDSLHFGVRSSNIPLWTGAPAVPLHPTPRLQAPTQEPLNLSK